MSQQPRVSIAVACVNGLPSIQACLDSLTRRGDGTGYETVVADRRGAGYREVVHRYANASLIPVDRPQATIPELRALAFRLGPGDSLARVE